MKIYVESVVKHTVAERVGIPSYQDPDRFTTGKVGTAIEVKVYAVSESEEDAASWEAMVGKFLQVVPDDVRPSGWERTSDGSV